MPSVARINVTPVKSTRVHHPEEIRVERYGPVCDRDFFFVKDDGKRLSGAAKAPLLQIRASFDRSRDTVELCLPDGRVLAGPAAATGRALVVDFYGRPVSAHVVEGPWAAAISEHAGTSLHLARVDEPGAGTDVEPVTLVSLASVEELARRGGRDRVDPARFRMTLEVEGCRPHEEDGWDGDLVRVGETRLRVIGAVPRCVITTLDPATGVRDFDTLKVINSYRPQIADEDGGIPFGVYARVERPGVVRVGDQVERLA